MTTSPTVETPKPEVRKFLIDPVEWMEKRKKHCYKIMDCTLESLQVLRCHWFLLWQIFNTGR